MDKGQSIEAPAGAFERVLGSGYPQPVDWQLETEVAVRPVQMGNCSRPTKGTVHRHLQLLLMQRDFIAPTDLCSR